MEHVKILMYHRIDNLTDDYNMQAVTPANFEEHMRYLREHYDILRLDDPVESWFQEWSGNAVIVTFDDGYYDFVQNAVPILEKYDIPATVFVATGNIDSSYENWTDSILRAIFSDNKQKDSLTFETEYYGGTFPAGTWSEKYALYQMVRKLFIVSSAEKRKQYEAYLLDWAGLEREGRGSRRIMTSAELRDVSTHKGISIGAHTVTHCSLRHQKVSEQRYEILESKKALEKITGQEVKLFAYPFGTRDDYSDVTINLLKEAGYEKAVTAYPGTMKRNTNVYELNRFPVKNYDEADFRDYMEHVVFGDENLVSDRGDMSVGKPLSYIGTLQQDNFLKLSGAPLVIWGAGYCGRELYMELAVRGICDRIVAFGDNDGKKVGGTLEDIPVLNLVAVKRMQRDNGCHILVKGNYAVEICKDLLEGKLYNIHLII